MKTEIITSNEELKKLAIDGLFFHLCVAFALNKGYRDILKEKKEVVFTIGDYKVKFNIKQMCFVLTHKEYFARIITAYYQQSLWIGADEDEVIADVLAEVEKELSKQSDLKQTT